MSDRSDNKRKPNFPQAVKRRITALLYAISILYAGYYSVMLPRFLVIEDKYAEGSNTIGAISRAQQAYFLEQQTFARRILDLGIRIRLESDNYSYRILYLTHPVPKRSFSPKTQSLPAIASIAYPKNDKLEVYVGIVKTMRYQNTNELTTKAIVCRSVSFFEVLQSEKYMYFGFRSFANFRQTGTRLTCPLGFEEIGR